jgi:hypothetical protein
MPFLIIDTCCLIHWTLVSKSKAEIRVVERRYRLVDLLLLVDGDLSWAHVDQQEETTATPVLAQPDHLLGDNLHNRKDLEEIVLRKVLVRVMRVQSPEVVDVEVEDAENEYQHDRRELGLETNNDHDARDKSEHASNNSPDTPVTAEDEANKEEDEEDTARKLEVHFLVLLVQSRKTRRGELLTHPRVRENHEQSSHDREIAQEEVEVENQAISDTLQNHDAHKTSYSVF